MTHTKGPWKVEKHKKDIEIWSNGAFIARLNDALFSTAEKAGETQNNARLISAAPEMFELLTTIRDEFKDQGLSTADIDKVLKKARGE